MTTVAAAVAIGLLIGLSLGALGGGGSILTVPALVLVLGQDTYEATAGSLVVVGVTALLAVVPHARAGNVHVGKGLVFGALGTAGSFVGSAVAARIAPDLLLAGFAVLMVVVGVVMLRRSGPTEPGESTSGAADRSTRRRVTTIVLTASAVGLLTGFFGVGGGFLIVPALVLALALPVPEAIGTSLLVISVNSGTALAARVGGGTIDLDWPLLATFTAAAVAASLVGGRITSRVSSRRLTRAFAVLVLVVALGTAAALLTRLW